MLWMACNFTKRRFHLANLDCVGHGPKAVAETQVAMRSGDATKDLER